MVTSQSPLNIIIVGAGLAGLAAAVGCALAGHKVVVLEGARELAEVGAGLQITPNASKILLRWGLPMEEAWAEPSFCTVHRYSDGKILAHEEKFAENNRRKYNAPFVDMHRVDAQKMLYHKAVELGVEVRLSSRVSAVREKGNGAEVELKDGTTFPGDLVVGADGLWSRCRESLLGKSDEPLPTGDLAFRIVLTLDQIKDEDLRRIVAEPQLHFWIGPNAHVVGYSVRSGTMYNLVLLTPDNLPPEVARQPGSLDEMKGLFDGWDPILTRFLECVTSVDKWKLMHRAELPSWTNDSKTILLIGDSCHPMLPYLAQGANSSIEDGAVLGGILSYVKSKEQLPKAIELFEELRKKRGEKVVRETFHQRHDFHMEDGPEQEERDKLFASQLGKDQADVKFPSRWTCPVVQPWLYGYDAYKEVDEAMQRQPL
ncbi:hypothetical protein H2198_002350 [Neophaeococcomyces mojaviensis]|uniref:Uncharacterized protein n=1 Tax=Neophaeococcomyces mojaviensis TaxID=3383035 RepID=A0ACC3AEH2_9EURO|nr:hypothetical protein H2198_002350 [Knufia sp. JES_112]